MAQDEWRRLLLDVLCEHASLVDQFDGFIPPAFQKGCKLSSRGFVEGPALDPIQKCLQRMAPARRKVLAWNARGDLGWQVHRMQSLQGASELDPLRLGHFLFVSVMPLNK